MQAWAMAQWCIQRALPQAIMHWIIVALAINGRTAIATKYPVYARTGRKFL